MMDRGDVESAATSKVIQQVVDELSARALIVDAGSPGITPVDVEVFDRLGRWVAPAAARGGESEPSALARRLFTAHYHPVPEMRAVLERRLVEIFDASRTEATGPVAAPDKAESEAEAAKAKARKRPRKTPALSPADTRQANDMAFLDRVLSEELFRRLANIHAAGESARVRYIAEQAHRLFDETVELLICREMSAVAGPLAGHVDTGELLERLQEHVSPGGKAGRPLAPRLGEDQRRLYLRGLAESLLVRGIADRHPEAKAVDAIMAEVLGAAGGYRHAAE